jgi:hypothetical protein
MAMFGLRFAEDILWNRIFDTRTICLTKAPEAGLQRQTQSDLAFPDTGTRHFSARATC